MRADGKGKRVHASQTKRTTREGRWGWRRSGRWRRLWGPRLSDRSAQQALDLSTPTKSSQRLAGASSVPFSAWVPGSLPAGCPLACLIQRICLGPPCLLRPAPAGWAQRTSVCPRPDQSGHPIPSCPVAGSGTPGGARRFTPTSPMIGWEVAASVGCAVRTERKPGAAGDSEDDPKPQPTRMGRQEPERSLL